MGKFTPIVSLCSVLLMVPFPALAGFMHYEGEDSSLKFSGDLRLRLEQDWDSRRGDGTERDDRLRLRGRARLRIDAR